MKRLHVKLHWAIMACVLAQLPLDPQDTSAQQPISTPVRTVLALTSLPSVVDVPLFLKLSKVELAAGKSANYFGPVGFIYVLSGSLTASGNGGPRALHKDDGHLAGAGKMHSFTTGSEPVVFLHFVLARAADLEQAAARNPAVVTELYRTPGPISHLKRGPYEFTLTRVRFPPRMLPNPPHYRSGAALYFVLSGSGQFLADGKQERKEIGMAHFEPYGWVHQWGNSADTPLELLQANISEEGVPAVIMGHPPATPRQ
jgi:quercetin dioxygenase-like cupin family protein